MYPEDLRYSEDHEWIRINGDTAEVGITEYAQDELGDVVYLEFPGVGDEFDAGDAFGVVESVKTISDLFMPVSGRVCEINERLLDEPELVNDDTYGEGWMVKIEDFDTSELEDLMTAEDYRAYIGLD